MSHNHRCRRHAGKCEISSAKTIGISEVEIANGLITGVSRIIETEMALASKLPLELGPLLAVKASWPDNIAVQVPSACSRPCTIEISTVCLQLLNTC
eukprot:SAG22_NODE_904_length_6586_cov_3.133498_3_plen_97_part_00